MIPGSREQIQFENTRGGLLRFSGIEIGLDEGTGEEKMLKVETPDSTDMEAFLMSFNSQDYF